MEQLENLGVWGARVHAGAFGFGRPAHVINPLKLMCADAFFLLENPDDEAYRRHKEAGTDVHEILDGTGIRWQRIELDLWSPASVGASLIRLVKEHDLPEILLNASVGPNTVAVGGNLASLFAPIRLYHPKGDQPAEPLRRLEDVSILPSIRAEGWDASHAVILLLLLELGGNATGSNLKDRLRDTRPDILGASSAKRHWPQKEHARFQTRLQFLERAGSVDISRAGRRWILRLTPQGEQMAQLLQPLAES